MNFCSDNATGIAPEILDAIAAANEGGVRGYGDDSLTEAVSGKIADLFETDARVFFVATGTAANALALSVMTPAYGGVICHREAHIEVDECGAPELYTGGAKLVLLDGADGKIDIDALHRSLAGLSPDVHHVQPRAVSISQLTETGAAYSRDEIAAITDSAHRSGLLVHMDGARFANALVATGCTPAEMSWKAGIDVLSFGASKNGAMAAEAVVIFNPDIGADFAYRRKRGGHLFSKMRFLAAQFAAYLDDDLWLRNARHANAAARRLHDGLKDIDGVSFLHPVNGNMMFVAMPEPMIAGLRADGFDFYDWPHAGPKSGAIRLVTAFNTRTQDVDALVASARHLAGT